MYGPPAISYSVDRSRWHAAALLGLCALALCGTVYATAAQAANPYVLTLWPVWLLATAFAALAWWRSPQGLLQWDGEQWFWGAESCQAHLQWDFQTCLVVRLARDGRRTQWLVLEQGDGRQWRALRRALANAHKEFTGGKPDSGLEALP